MPSLLASGLERARQHPGERDALQPGPLRDDVPAQLKAAGLEEVKQRKGREGELGGGTDDFGGRGRPRPGPRRRRRSSAAGPGATSAGRGRSSKGAAAARGWLPSGGEGGGEGCMRRGGGEGGGRRARVSVARTRPPARQVRRAGRPSFERGNTPLTRKGGNSPSWRSLSLRGSTRSLSLPHPSSPAMRPSLARQLNILVPIKRTIDYTVKPRLVNGAVDHAVKHRSVPVGAAAPRPAPALLPSVPAVRPSVRGLNPPPLAHRPSLNPFDEIAVEEALRIRAAAQKAGGAAKVDKITAVSVGGPKTVETLRTALAMGAVRSPLSLPTRPSPAVEPRRFLLGVPLLWLGLGWAGGGTDRQRPCGPVSLAGRRRPTGSCVGRSRRRRSRRSAAAPAPPPRPRASSALAVSRPRRRRAPPCALLSPSTGRERVGRPSEPAPLSFPPSLVILGDGRRRGR